jgi:hypothetical protein
MGSELSGVSKEFRCGYCRRHGAPGDHGIIGRIGLTGRRKPNPKYRVDRADRLASSLREYECRDCGFRGWSGHLDLQRMEHDLKQPVMRATCRYCFKELRADRTDVWKGKVACPECVRHFVDEAEQAAPKLPGGNEGRNVMNEIVRRLHEHGYVFEGSNGSAASGTMTTWVKAHRELVQCVRLTYSGSKFGAVGKRPEGRLTACLQGVKGKQLTVKHRGNLVDLDKVFERIREWLGEPMPKDSPAEGAEGRMRTPDQGADHRQ